MSKRADRPRAETTPPAPARITAGDVADLALGCTLLGCGAGDDARLVQPVLEHVLAGTGPLELHLDHPDPRRDVVLVGVVGPAVAAAEVLLMGDALARVVARLAAPSAGHRHGSGRRGAGPAVAPLTVGGPSGLLGVLAAARAGLPLVDAARPSRLRAGLGELGTGGLVGPVLVARPGGGLVILEDPPVGGTGRLVGDVVGCLGGTAAVAVRRTGRPRRLAPEAGTLTRALRLGAALAARRRREVDGSEALARMGAVSPFNGTVLEVLHPGVMGTVTLSDDSAPSRTLRVDVADDYAAATLDGHLVAAAPDGIALLESRTWAPVSVNEVRVGQRLRLLCLPAPAGAGGGPGPDLTAYGVLDPRPRVEAR